MISYPAELPQNFSANTKIKDNESRAIQQMDSGPASVRNRFTAVTETIETTVTLDGYQLGVFLSFFRDTLSNGAFSFFWKHPITEETCKLRFKEKPEFVCVKPGLDMASRIWQASWSLETVL